MVEFIQEEEFWTYNNGFYASIEMALIRKILDFFINLKMGGLQVPKFLIFLFYFIFAKKDKSWVYIVN